MPSFPSEVQLAHWSVIDRVLEQTGRGQTGRGQTGGRAGKQVRADR